MLKKNKFKVIISSIIILLPILYGIIMWNDLPAIITTHWGADGNADGLSGKVFAVFGTPIILLIFHFVCLLFTSLDKRQKDQNQKALGMVFWILPIISLFTNGIMYRAAFGKEFDLAFFMPALLGVMFISIGNSRNISIFFLIACPSPAPYAGTASRKPPALAASRFMKLLILSASSFVRSSHLRYSVSFSSRIYRMPVIFFIPEHLRFIL